ncbi:tyrosine-type recombinase/integrase [Anatilimnocola sp. NA78]|uniref:tyrosine-type recombinase/integrase n=1 Tax=Anatilimnocola sp. NA78 TaxID=3415683 RepID=UPI003CE559D7
MTKRTDNRGRVKGSRNKGYFFRKGRGWFSKNAAGKFVPLKDESGALLRNENTPELQIKQAYARHTLSSPQTQTAASGVTVEEVCSYYIQRAERESRSTTVEKRADTLFDLCYGLSPRWRETAGRKVKGRPTAADKIHPGYAKMAVADLRPHHLEAWLDAHKEDKDKGYKGWKSNSGRKTRLQAVKRALNRAAEGGLIAKDHAIRGMRVPKGRARVTYITPEQEAALLKECNSSLRLALSVLIRSGMRPGVEFAALTAAHVTDQGERLELTFKASESKTNRERVIRIKEVWLIEAIRKQIRHYPDGPLFRNHTGGPCEVKALSRSFRRAVKNAQKTIQFDADVCLYSCRHTFAKRALTGFWSGKPINMELLATLMGNTPKVCAEHYADILKKLSGVEELIWAAC